MIKSLQSYVFLLRGNLIWENKDVRMMRCIGKSSQKYQDSQQICAVYYSRIPDMAKACRAYQQGLSLQILKNAFADFFGIRLLEEAIKRTPDGKPYYNEGRDIFFNISHCPAAVAVAVAKVPVGVDVEGIRRVKKRTVDKCCNVLERAYVFGQHGYDRKPEEELTEEEAKRFLGLWTLKESYVKMTGRGLRIPVNTVCFDISGFECAEPGILQQTKPGEYKACLHLQEGIAMALTTQLKTADADVKILWIPYASAPAGA